MPPTASAVMSNQQTIAVIDLWVVERGSVEAALQTMRLICSASLRGWGICSLSSVATAIATKGTRQF